MFLQAFRVPPDFDDTFVNLGMGALLHEMREDFASSYATWTKSNNNLQTGKFSWIVIIPSFRVGAY